MCTLRGKYSNGDRFSLPTSAFYLLLLLFLRTEIKYKTDLTIDDDDDDDDPPQWTYAISE